MVILERGGCCLMVNVFQNRSMDGWVCRLNQRCRDLGNKLSRESRVSSVRLAVSKHSSRKFTTFCITNCSTALLTPYVYRSLKFHIIALESTNSCHTRHCQVNKAFSLLNSIKPKRVNQLLQFSPCEVVEAKQILSRPFSKQWNVIVERQISKFPSLGQPSTYPPQKPTYYINVIYVHSFHFSSVWESVACCCHLWSRLSSAFCFTVVCLCCSKHTGAERQLDNLCYVVHVGTRAVSELLFLPMHPDKHGDQTPWSSQPRENTAM